MKLRKLLISIVAATMIFNIFSVLPITARAAENCRHENWSYYDWTCVTCGVEWSCEKYRHIFQRGETKYDYCIVCYVSVSSAESAPPTSVPNLTPSVEPYSKGDVRGDGNIDVSNAVEILKYIAGLPNVISGNVLALAAADTNGDGEIDVQDAIEILRYIAGLSNAISG